MVGALKVRVENENEADKFNNVKKFGVTTATENPKRSALGDLQNRGVLRATGIGKEAAQKDLKDSKVQLGLRNAKPRVDTHWKKSTLTSAATTAAGHKNVSAQPAAAGQPKVLTRSNSVRLVGSGTAANKTSGSGAHLPRRGSGLLHEGQHSRLKTLTTKVVESKLQQVKHISKVTKPKLGEEKAPITAAAALKREDSNLSRRSLAKLKTVLRDASSATAGVTKAINKIKSVETTVPVHVKAAEKIRASSTSAVAKTAATNASDDAQPIIQNVPELKIVSVQSHSRHLLNDVENIDAGDVENLVLVSEYVNDIYDYLYCLEAEHEIQQNHLDGQKEVSAKMRSVLVDWINEVHLQFHCIVETYQIAVAIIDRYLQAVKDTQRSHLQLVGVTALFIAAKYEELYPPTIADFVFISDNTYTAKQILQMELQIFKTLDCNLSRPLPIQFLRRFSKAASAEDVHHGMAKYFLELASIEYDMAAYKPSEIAAASLYLSMNLLQGNAKTQTGFNDKHWSHTLEWYSRYTASHLQPIAKKLATVVRNAPNAKLKAVYTKYQSSKFHKISMRPELCGAIMNSIVGSKE